VARSRTGRAAGPARPRSLASAPLANGGSAAAPVPTPLARARLASALAPPPTRALSGAAALARPRSAGTNAKNKKPERTAANPIRIPSKNPPNCLPHLQEQEQQESILVGGK